MERTYSDAKPLQDQLAEKSVEILTLSAEVFRRIIAKHLPEVEWRRTNIVTELSCSLNCLGQPALELSRRLNQFKEQGVNIVAVEFDEMQRRYIFHTAPKGGAPEIVEQ